MPKQHTDPNEWVPIEVTPIQDVDEVETSFAPIYVHQPHDTPEATPVVEHHTDKPAAGKKEG